MLTIQKSKSHQGKCIPNVLPCRINHNGAVDTSERYWNPTTRNGQKVSYFRGRKLHARNLKVPKGYKGVVAVKTERVLPSQRKEVEEKEDPDDEGEGEQEPEPEIKVIEEESSFDEFVVWGHEAVMDEGDPYVRGVEEWIGFAEGIHSFGTDESEGEAGEKKE